MFKVKIMVGAGRLLIRMESSPDQYERAGFRITPNPDGSLSIVAILKPVTPRDSLPPLDQEYDFGDELFFQCALNLAVFGPRGSVIIDPMDKGLLVHVPTFSRLSRMRLTSRGRKLFRHGLWLIDVVHGLDKSTTSITDAKLEDTFKVSKKGELLIVERKLEHDMPAYRSRYIVKFKPDGSATIRLARKKRNLSYLKQIFKLKEISITVGRLEFTGIEFKFKRE